MLNALLATLRESPTLEVADRIRKLEAAGRSVVKLQTGDPDFDTPGPIIDAALRAMRSGLTHYSNTRGLPELRQALASRMKCANGVDYDAASEILITHGGVHAIFVVLQTLLNPLDEVIIPEPCWMPYVAATTLAGARPVMLSTRPENKFKPTGADIRKVATSRTRVLIINTPNNPTGAVLSRSEHLVYDGLAHTSIASLPGMKDRVVTVQSFSKTFAMTGWRLGYLGAPKEVCSEILKVSQYTVTNISPFVQAAGLAALDDATVAAAVEQMKSRYGARRRYLTDALGSIQGVKFHEPEGAFYFMLDVRPVQLDSARFAEGLLEKEFVGVVPGVGFGWSGQGHVRITFAASEQSLEEGVCRIARYVGSLR
jgi:aspartate/methionine/tyrosine aminotransferase